MESSLEQNAREHISTLRFTLSGQWKGQGCSCKGNEPHSSQVKSVEPQWGLTWPVVVSHLSLKILQHVKRKEGKDAHELMISLWVPWKSITWVQIQSNLRQPLTCSWFVLSLKEGNSLYDQNGLLTRSPHGGLFLKTITLSVSIFYGLCSTRVLGIPYRDRVIK